MNSKNSERIIRLTHPLVADACRATDDSSAQSFFVRIMQSVDQSIPGSPVLVAFFEAIITSGKLKSANSKELRKISEALDDDYFTLKESGAPENEWAPLFHEARLAYACALAADGVTQDNIADILYEIAHAHDPPSMFLNRIMDGLNRPDDLS